MIWLYLLPGWVGDHNVEPPRHLRGFGERVPRPAFDVDRTPKARRRRLDCSDPSSDRLLVAIPHFDRPILSGHGLPLSLLKEPLDQAAISAKRVSYGSSVSPGN